MNRYTYKARDKAGKVVVGDVEAQNEHAAAKLIRNRGMIVVSISKSGDNLWALLKKFQDRISTSDIATFTRQLSTMVNAGLPITEALVVLRSQSKPSMQKLVAQILNDVEGGESLSAALGKHPKIFSSTYLALVKSGEAGGVMDKVLARLADNLEKEQEFTGKVKGALIYPAIIVVGMGIVGIVMMIFVIPRLTSLYADFNADLPLPTKILIGLSTFLIRFWPLFVLVGGIGIYGLSAYRKTPEGRHKTDELILKLPIYGDLQRQILLTEITRTLSLMIGAGVSILEALNITAKVVANVILADALTDAAKQVEKGFPIAYSFAKHPEAFPFILSQMIAVGEETGKMEEVLTKVSTIFEIESDQKVKTLTASIEPLVMVLLGLGVGFLVIAIILPIYNLTSKF